MSKYLLLLLIYSASKSVFCQTQFKQNDVYAESFGIPLSIISINYEHQLQRKPAFGLRVGIGYYGFGVDQNLFTIAGGVNYLLKLNDRGKSFFEAGMGTTLSSDEGFKDPPMGVAPKDFYENIFSYNVDAGFRQHLIKDKLMWRIDISLIMNKYRTIGLPGLSLGYRF